MHGRAQARGLPGIGRGQVAEIHVEMISFDVRNVCGAPKWRT